jgi:hypothetical protein
MKPEASHQMPDEKPFERTNIIEFEPATTRAEATLILGLVSAFLLSCLFLNNVFARNSGVTGKRETL